MNRSLVELDNWLGGGDIYEEQLPGADNWIAGFDADRQAVVIKLGPYKRVFLRPQKFTKRFYHQLYSLTIETWSYRRQIKLFDDFCTLDMVLDLRFQATLPYVQKHSELLPTINQHIRQTYAGLVDDVVNRELQNLDEGSWVQTGISGIEKNIVNSLCEMLAIQQIQSQAICNIKVSFEDFPAVQPGRENVYLNVLKKTFEINDQKSRELVRQQRLLEEQELQEKQRQLEHLREVAELELAAQALDAEKTRRLLEEKEDQLALQLAIEKRIHAERIRHEAELKEMLFDIELRTQEQQQAKQRLAEIQQVNEQLAHQALIEEKKLLAELARRDKIAGYSQDTNFRFDEGVDDENE